MESGRRKKPYAPQTTQALRVQGPPHGPGRARELTLFGDSQIMCFIEAGASAAAIANATLAVTAATTAASIGIGLYQSAQASAQAQAQLNYQAGAQQQQMEMQRQQMLLSQTQQTQALQQQQNQLAQQLELQQRQGQAAYNLQVEQTNAQLVSQYNQARQQVLNEQATIMARNAADRLTYQRTYETAREQIANNNEAANKVYVAEQTKITEAQRRAAFEQQAILAKSIGNAGNVLAAGRTGASIGLLLNDVERQKGFALAQESASLASKQQAAVVAMDQAGLQATSANNQAMSSVAFRPQDPYLPKLPENPRFIRGIGLEVPTFESFSRA